MGLHADVEDGFPFYGTDSEDYAAESKHITITALAQPICRLCILMQRQDASCMPAVCCASPEASSVCARRHTCAVVCVMLFSGGDELSEGGAEGELYADEPYGGEEEEGEEEEGEDGES